MIMDECMEGVVTETCKDEVAAETTDMDMLMDTDTVKGTGQATVMDPILAAMVAPEAEAGVEKVIVVIAGVMRV